MRETPKFEMYDYSEHSLSDLYDEQVTLDAEIVSIENQLDRYENNPISPDWPVNTRIALRIKRKQLEIINRTIKRRKSERIENLFIDEVRNRYGSTVVTDIIKTLEGEV